MSTKEKARVIYRLFLDCVIYTLSKQPPLHSSLTTPLTIKAKVSITCYNQSKSATEFPPVIEVVGTCLC